MASKDAVVELYTRSKLLKAAYWFIVNTFSVFLVLSLYVIRPFRYIKLCRIMDERIGHLAPNTELFLRRLDAGIIGKKGRAFIGIASKSPSNGQLLKMYRRRMRIIQIPQPKYVRFFVQSIFREQSFFGRSRFFQSMPCYSDEFYEFSLNPTLSFTEQEEKEGAALLDKMGIKRSNWFICFHTRDSRYHSVKVDNSADWSSHYTRDSSIKNYLAAADYITSKGGIAVRMGYLPSEELSDTENKKIIDYACRCRTDFGDIYLPAKCKFFLGGSAGLLFVPEVLNVPVACANFTPPDCTPFRKGDLFIPKKIWSKKAGRFLAFREIFSSEICKYLEAEQYEKAGLELVENTPEEIFDLAKEMNERLDGVFKPTEEDEALQQRFLSFIMPHHSSYGTPARIGAMFLRKNKKLLD